MLTNIAKYMCIIRVNYNAKELKLVTTTTPKRWLLGKVVLGEMKRHDDMTTDKFPRCAIET